MNLSTQNFVIGTWKSWSYIFGAIFFCAILSNCLSSDDYSNRIFGQITDSITKQAIKGADIFIAEIEGKRFLSTASDEDGNYSLSDVFTGEIRIDVTAEGYKSTFRNFIFQFDKEENFSLEPL